LEQQQPRGNGEADAHVCPGFPDKGRAKIKKVKLLYYIRCNIGFFLTFAPLNLLGVTYMLEEKQL